MAPSVQVVQWMAKFFPKPRVDSEWLDGCTQWLEEDQNLSSVTDFPQFMERVKGQLLESDLLDSMQTGTGFDDNILTMSGHLRGPPVLVQITAITDISSSAYQLDQIRAAREERMLAGEGDEEGDDDGDVEVEGEGPMPKYPRGTLRFQLSDGNKTIQAMEYRQISGFTLGNTPLGCKMQLKGTKFQNGMAMLEPDTVILLGGKQSDMEAKQLEDFKWSLHARLGRPIPPPEEIIAGVSATTAVRSPLTGVPVPAAPLLQDNDDVDLEPRRRLPASSSSNQSSMSFDENDVKQMRPTKGLPSRKNGTKVGSSDEISGERSQDKRSISIAERATLTHAGSRGIASQTTSPYFHLASGSASRPPQSSAINTAVEALDFDLEPTHRQMSRSLPSSEPFQSYQSPTSDYFNFDLLDEVDQENQIPLLPSSLHKGKGRQQDLGDTFSSKTLPSINDDRNSDEYNMDDDNDFDNPSFLQEIDVLEKAALQTTPKISTVFSSSGIGSNPSSSKSHTEKRPILSSSPKSSCEVGHSRVAPTDVIEIEDSDDEMQDFEDKENMPVPTRHVRRRIEHVDTAGPSSIFPLQSQLSQKSGRPIVLATNPDDIIDLSDSDSDSPS